MNLFDYILHLNTCDNSWGLWVNPDDPENDFRIGQRCFENGGILDDFVYVGNLASLSPCVSSIDELKNYLENTPYLLYKNKKVRFNKKGMIDAYEEDRLDQDFKNFLDEEIGPLIQEEREFQAMQTVEQILSLIEEKYSD